MRSPHQDRRDASGAKARARLTPLWLALGLVAAPLSASAQDAADAAPVPEVEAVPEVDAEAAAAEAARAAAEEEARNRFRQGLTLARSGDCGAALAEFEASYALVPRPNTLFNMAQCEERLHRYDLAIEQYEHYLEIAPPEAEDRDTVMATLDSLRGLLGTIHVEVNAPSEVWLGDRIVGTAPGDVLVPGGRHALELRATGYLPERREVEVAARQRIELTVTLSTAETHIENTTIENTTIEETHIHEHVTVERPPVPLPVFIAGLVLTGAAGLGGAAAGIAALVRHDQIAAMEALLPRDGTPVRDAAIAADVLFISCGVFAVGTLVLGLLTDFGGDEPADDAAAPTLTLAPWASDTSAGVVVGGSL